MVVELTGQAYGMLLLNSNAMGEFVEDFWENSMILNLCLAYTILPAPAIALKTTGGILDLFLFVGDNPEHVVQLYTGLIGRPFMPPFWGLGYQQCRWGYHNLTGLKTVVDRTLSHGMPLDVQYLDSEYKNSNMDFTLSEDNFAKLPEYINETRKQHQLHWSAIVHPAIHGDRHNYFAFDEGYRREVFVRWPTALANSGTLRLPKNVPTDRRVVYGKITSPGPVAWVDFFKPTAVAWWKDMIQQLHKQLPFDALWLSNNEPTNLDEDAAEFYSCPVNKYSFNLRKSFS